MKPNIYNHNSHVCTCTTDPSVLKLCYLYVIYTLSMFSAARTKFSYDFQYRLQCMTICHVTFYSVKCLYFKHHPSNCQPHQCYFHPSMCWNYMDKFAKIYRLIRVRVTCKWRDGQLRKITRTLGAAIARLVPVMVQICHSGILYSFIIFTIRERCYASFLWLLEVEIDL